ncbi:MAG: response regulator transcription factor [Burkholderiales bacterium]|nr:response regulator transcription factor [Burkholderiales bacterium]
MLTRRETTILALVADGKANKEIARTLGISDNTVETHLRRVYQKLDCRTRTQSVAKAREPGLLR